MTEETNVKVKQMEETEDKIQNKNPDEIQDKNQDVVQNQDAIQNKNQMQNDVKDENSDKNKDENKDEIKDEKIKSVRRRKPRKKRNMDPSFIMTPEQKAAKKAAEEQAKKVEEEYAKKSDEEIQKEAEDALVNLIKLAIEESDYFGGSELKLRKDGQVEITRTSKRKKIDRNDKDKGKRIKNERLFDRDGYPVDSVEEALDRYYEKFPEKIENRKKAAKKMASRRDPDEVINMCDPSDNEKTSGADKDKTGATGAEGAQENMRYKSFQEYLNDLKKSAGIKIDSDSVTGQVADEAAQGTKKKRSKSKSKNKDKNGENTKKKVSRSFLTEVKAYAMEERRKRLMEKYPVRKVFADDDVELFEVPKEIYANPKADTCELEEVACVRLYDDPYIEMTIDFNFDAKVKKPRKKSSII